MSLWICKPLKIKNNVQLESYYNGYLVFLVSEQIIKKFADKENLKIKRFKKTFLESMIKIIRMNGLSLKNSLDYNDNEQNISSIILNMSQQYNLLYDTSLEKYKKPN